MAAESPLKRERTLLQKEVRQESSIRDLGQDNPPEDKKDDPKTLSTPQKTGIAATGIVFMCCSFLCPCFYRKRKATALTVLEKDPNSSEYKFI